MRYFTRQLWLSAQQPGLLKEYDQRWDKASAEYLAQLSTLGPRLNQEAYKFFAEADVHDAELLVLVLEDGSRPAPFSEPVRPWRVTKDYPIKVKLSILDANDKFIWNVSYSICAGQSSIFRPAIRFSIPRERALETWVTTN